MLTRLSLLLPILLVLSGAAAYGQSQELMDAYVASKELYANGAYSQALPLAEKAARLSEREFGSDHPTSATILNDLALVYLALARYEDAWVNFERALLIREESLGPTHPSVGKTLAGLGAVHYDQDRYAEAEPYLERSLMILMNAHGPDHPDVASAHNSLGELYTSQGLYAEAEPHLKNGTIDMGEIVWRKSSKRSSRSQ